MMSEKKFSASLSLSVVLISTMIFLLSTNFMSAATPSYQELKTKAEKLYAEGSYQLAREVYEKVEIEKLSKDDARWVRFRLADTLWRSKAGMDSPPASDMDMNKARKQLESLLDNTKREADRDMLWAQIQVSLADSWLVMKRWNHNWESAWPHYKEALNWWAGSTDIDNARREYLSIIRKMMALINNHEDDYYSNERMYRAIPESLLDDAGRIAVKPSDRAAISFLKAMKDMKVTPVTLQTQQQVIEHLKDTIKSGKESGWYYEALYRLAGWYEESKVIHSRNKIYYVEADYPQAIKIYDRLIAESSDKETSFHKLALDRKESLLKKGLDVSNQGIYRPGSSIDIKTTWQNTGKIEFNIYRVNIASRTFMEEIGRKYKQTWGIRPLEFMRNLKTEHLERVRHWTRSGSAKGDMATHSDYITLSKELPPGAYLLEAKSGMLVSRTMINVTDMVLMGSINGGSLVFYVCDVQTGAPVEGAEVTLYCGGKNELRSMMTDKGGMADFSSCTGNVEGNYVVSALKGDMGVYWVDSSYRVERREIEKKKGSSIKACIFTDRPAYRPGETVHWKIIAREPDRNTYKVPDKKTYYYEVRSEDSETTASQGQFKLGDYGSAWGYFSLSKSLPLGRYEIIISNDKPVNSKYDGYMAGETLFRLEEYKLPEFRVLLTTPGTKGKALRPGDEVKVLVDAAYYSGESVPGGDVEIKVYGENLSSYELRKPPEKDEGEDCNKYGWKKPFINEKLHLDESGKAEYVFKIPDFENPRKYHVVARVTDASRRMVQADTVLRAARKRSWASLHTDHNIFENGKPVPVSVKTVNVLGEPISAEGKILVTRKTYGEVWVDPCGKLIYGRELEKLRQSGVFPPLPQGPCNIPWKCKDKFSEKDEKVLERKITTEGNGKADFNFTPVNPGSYTISWQDSDDGKPEKKNIWVAEDEISDTQVSSGDIELILDHDKVNPGDTEKVLVVCPAPGSNIILTENRMGKTIRKMLKINGIAKILKYHVTKDDYPGINLSVDCVAGGKILHGDSRNIPVSTANHNLHLAISTDRKNYGPRNKALFKIRAQDSVGNPARAEVAFGVVDKSIYTIAKDSLDNIAEIFYPEETTAGYRSGVDFSTLDYGAYVSQKSEGSLSDLHLIMTGAGLSPEKMNPPMITGKVTDENGAPIPGATLLAYEENGGECYGALSGPDGKYVIPLPERKVWKIKLVAKAAVYGTVIRSGIEIPKDAVVNVPFCMNISSEDIVIMGKAPNVSIAKTACAVGGSYYDYMVEGGDYLRGGVVGGVAGGVLGGVLEGPENSYSVRSPAFSGLIDVRNNMGNILFLAPGAMSAPVKVYVRHDFRTTACWKPDVITDDNGAAEIEVTLPDSLTTWSATARAETTGNMFGQERAEIKTSQELTVRLEAPRFFIVKDRATVSAVITNNGKKAMTVRPELRVTGLKNLGVEKKGRISRTVTVPPGGQKRVDWLVEAETKGTASITALAAGNDCSDAMSHEYPVYEHGMKKLSVAAGKVNKKEGVFRIDLPAERKKRSTVMKVSVTPSLAVTMLDALPYLVRYPYGCTEQTMSRFVPTVVTVKTLQQLGLGKADIEGKVFGGVEAENTVNTHPEGKKTFNEMDKVIKDSLTRIYSFHQRDGGWGWWGDSRGSSPYMTAYVVWGLTLAADSGLTIDTSVLKSGYNYLLNNISSYDNQPALQAWMLFAISSSYHLQNYAEGQVPLKALKVLEILWKKKDSANAYNKALLALSAKELGDEEKAQVLVRNLANGVIRDKDTGSSILLDGKNGAESPGTSNNTAHWGRQTFWWQWYDSPVETTAFALRAIVDVNPSDPLVQPVLNWLLKNRRGAQWSSTKETAITILALDTYLEKSRELVGKSSYKVVVNGRELAQRDVDRRSILDLSETVSVPRNLIKNGVNSIKVIKTSGKGPLYVSASASYFSFEDPVPPSGNEIFVKRRYFRVRPVKTLLNGVVYRKAPLKENEMVNSGDYIECVLTLEIKNDYEYLLIEDNKPAGFEALQLHSGEAFYARGLTSASAKLFFAHSENGATDTAGDRQASDYTNDNVWGHQEMRDSKVAFFIDNLDQGFWEIRYELRAEVPGKFHALPATAAAMYVPEIRGNSSEEHVKIKDREKH